VIWPAFVLLLVPVGITQAARLRLLLVGRPQSLLARVCASTPFCRKQFQRL
jgi:hypothetical protein